MAYNGSGTFVRIYNWATDKTNLVPVTASRMDTEFDGIATGLSTAIAKDGQTPTTARIPFAAGTSAFGGAVGGVSYAQTNDPNTGVYFPAADQVSLAAGGVAVVAATATTVTIPVDLVVSGSVTGVFPSGTKMIFYQASAPTGWTAVAQNDRALRVVSAGGTGGTSGGTNAFSTVMAQTTTGSTAISIAQMPSHDHGTNTGLQSDDHTHNFTAVLSGAAGNGAGTGGGQTIATGASTGTTAGVSNSHSHVISAQGGGGGHTHTMTMAMQYADVIIASKD